MIRAGADLASAFIFYIALELDEVHLFIDFGYISNYFDIST